MYARVQAFSVLLLWLWMHLPHNQNIAIFCHNRFMSSSMAMDRCILVIWQWFSKQCGRDDFLGTKWKRLHLAFYSVFHEAPLGRWCALHQIICFGRPDPPTGATLSLAKWPHVSHWIWTYSPLRGKYLIIYYLTSFILGITQFWIGIIE